MYGIREETISTERVRYKLYIAMLIAARTRCVVVVVVVVIVVVIVVLFTCLLVYMFTCLLVYLFSSLKKCLTMAGSTNKLPSLKKYANSFLDIPNNNLVAMENVSIFRYICLNCLFVYFEWIFCFIFIFYF